MGERAYKIGQHVMVPVPILEDTTEGKRPIRPKTEPMRLGMVTHTNSRDGRYRIRVNKSHTDEYGNPHVVYAREDELRLATRNDAGFFSAPAM